MTVARLEQPVAAAPVRETKSRSELLQSWRRFRANRAALVGLVFIVVICIAALFANVLIPYDPTFSYPGMRGVGSSWEHPLGYDHIGRDLLARVIFGARVALMVGLGATVISALRGMKS